MLTEENNKLKKENQSMKLDKNKSDVSIPHKAIYYFNVVKLMCFNIKTNYFLFI